MLTLKSSKHRCQCYSESGSLLYGLRRDAPSTERVLLERLVNILSRAAAQQNKNPQRLWADSERPEWWTKVTKLQWKNPREHPKDNKDTLKKKIEVLEKQLKDRKLMTKELEEELAIHRGSKKVDLELKSDFEAIISKASGLHFMLDKVSGKMGHSRLISDKMATYINETKSCIDKIHSTIKAMHQQVQAREERKSDLWEAMGVSKQQRAAVPEDLATETLTIDPLEEFYHDVFPYFPVDSSHFFAPYSTPSPSPTPQSPELSDASVMQKMYSAVSPLSPPPVATEKVFVPISSAEPHLELPGMQKSRQTQSAITVRSFPRSSSLRTDAEEGSMNPSQGRAAPDALFTVSKRPRTQCEDLQLGQTRAKSPRLRQSLGLSVSPNLSIMIDDDDDNEEEDDSRRFSESPEAPVKDTRLSPETGTTGHGLLSKHRKTVHSHIRPASSAKGDTSSALTVLHSPWSLSGDPEVQSALTASPSIASDRQERTATLSGTTLGTRAPGVSADTADKTFLPMDVVEDAGDDLDFVEEVIEDSETPTMTMYAPDTSEMDHLADMATALSCEDLSPSVMESVMTGELSDPHVSRPVSLSTTSTAPSRLWPSPRQPTRRPPRKLGAMDVTLGQRPQTPTVEVVKKPAPVYLVLSHGAEQNVPTPFTGLTVPQRHGPQSAQPRSSTAAVRSRKRDEGDSLSKAIGGLSADFSHSK